MLRCTRQPGEPGVVRTGKTRLWRARAVLKRAIYRVRVHVDQRQCRCDPTASPPFDHHVQFADPPFAKGSVTVRALAGAVRHAASFAILEPQPDARIVAELVRRVLSTWRY